MYNTNDIQIITRRKAAEKFGCSLPTIDRKAKNGDLPPTIKMIGGSVGFIKQEIDIVFTAFILGKSEDEVKELIQRLVKFRDEVTMNFVA